MSKDKPTTKDVATQTTPFDYSPTIVNKAIRRILTEHKNFAIENGWVEYLQSNNSDQEVINDAAIRKHVESVIERGK